MNDSLNPLADYTQRSLSSVPVSQTEGEGFYLQTGYLMGNWQPWFLIEKWQAKDTSGNGSWQAIRIGFSYHFLDKTSSLKIALENTRLEGVNAQNITTAGIGIFMNY